MSEIILVVDDTDLIQRRLIRAINHLKEIDRMKSEVISEYTKRVEADKAQYAAMKKLKEVFELPKDVQIAYFDDLMLKLDEECKRVEKDIEAQKQEVGSQVASKSSLRTFLRSRRSRPY